MGELLGNTDHWILLLKKTGLLMVHSLGMGLPPKCCPYVEEEAGMLRRDVKKA